MTEADIQTIREIFSHQLGIYADDVQHKLDLVVEGQQMLAERLDRFEVEVRSEFVKVAQRIDGVHAGLDQKIDHVEQKLTDRIDGVEQKLTNRIDGVEQNLTDHIDAMAADLAAHRRDTEAHRIYGAKE